MAFKVGYAQEIITPSLERPVYLAGFGQNRRAETVHDDLYVKALALSLEEIRVVVAALDLIGLGRQHCQEIERRVNAEVPGTLPPFTTYLYEDVPVGNAVFWLIGRPLRYAGCSGIARRRCCSRCSTSSPRAAA